MLWDSAPKVEVNGSTERMKEVALWRWRTLLEQNIAIKMIGRKLQIDSFEVFSEIAFSKYTSEKAFIL